MAIMMLLMLILILLLMLLMLLPWWPTSRHAATTAATTAATCQLRFEARAGCLESSHVQTLPVDVADIEERRRHDQTVARSENRRRRITKYKTKSIKLY
jgi:hypothetical protein